MPDLPDRLKSVAELDELLSRPSPALIATLRELEGDIMVLGASGKMGPTLARMAQRGVAAAGTGAKVYAVARSAMPELAEHGVQTVRCDLLDLAAVERLPRARNVVFMAGRKFGSTGAEHLTWAINTIVPYHVGRTFTDSRIVSFSTGCVYPVVHLYTGGSTEAMRPEPVGEYAMSCLGRERVFDYLSSVHHQPVVHIRLNYAVEPRYGVLADIASRIWQGQPVDVTTGFANVIWQGDACDHILRSFTLASSPPAILNVTGPETFAVRQVALRLGELLGKPVTFTGEENGRGYLNNASQALRHFGYPQVPLGKLLEWTAQWVADGGASLGKPTHFETQDGKY